MKENQEQLDHYIALFEELFRASTKVVKLVFWTLLCTLICFQICMQIPQLRVYLSFVYRMDGIPMVERNVKDW
ncbi:hypothetical protein [Paenibacillus antarcticus]|uniref:Uncharacterized protein n=1 Tax=Paenibacillus antarcticus TaxID=253703 RepID=A0A162QBM8_9BACL|nr:hypothetical protein [Paenibacillus antarcticus]OAB46940.1 hypothetical protein PBAT_09775 [Paenibacillus antarcticus]